MKKIWLFLKSTRIASRVLFCLCIIGSVGFNFAEETRLQIVLECIAIFLIPALIIELLKNPVLRNKEQQNHGNTLWDVIKNISASSITLLHFGVLAIAVMTLNAEETFEMGVAFGIFCYVLIAVIFFGSIGLVEYYKNPVLVELRKNKPIKTYYDNDRYISPCLIAAIPCAILAFIGIIVFLTGTAEDPAEAFPPLIVFGIAAVVLFILSLNAPKTKTEARARKAAKEHAKKMLAYEGVYLSEEQILNLENGTKLPNISVPMFLQPGEIAVYHCRATRQETKNRVIGRSGSYGGGTVRIAKGFSIHAGSSSSTPIYGDVYFNYDGEFVITNRRVVFLSNNKGFELSHNNITAATAYTDGLLFQSKSSSYLILLPCAYLARIAFDGVRSGEIPYSNDNTYEYDEPIEVTENNISSVDEMDGHEFEYFCADVLKKNGFADVSVTKGSGDQGVDILANRGGVKYAIQCKHYSSPLGNKPIQEVNAGKTFYNCHVGVVMTNSTFTSGAVALAEATGVLLWDEAELQRMINDANI